MKYQLKELTNIEDTYSPKPNTKDIENRIDFVKQLFNSDRSFLIAFVRMIREQLDRKLALEDVKLLIYRAYRDKGLSCELRCKHASILLAEVFREMDLQDALAALNDKETL